MRIFKNNHMTMEGAGDGTIFAVATSSATPPETRASLCPYYFGQKELIKAIDGKVGIRFKKCSTVEEAREFSELTLEELEPKYSIEKSLSPLPGVGSTATLLYLIRNGKVDQFVETVWTNPRFLLSPGETPEIIHPGMRRNALHLAVQYHNLELCWNLMKIIKDDQFWKLVYPLSDVRVRNRSKIRLVDLYLNMQDGNARTMVNGLEKHYTPLHIASMNGFQDIVKFLMLFPATDTTVRDNQGRTAADVAYLRCSNTDKLLKSKIRDLINNPMYPCINI